jgi:hypothetical protein
VAPLREETHRYRQQHLEAPAVVEPRVRNAQELPPVQIQIMASSITSPTWELMLRDPPTVMVLQVVVVALAVRQPTKTVEHHSLVSVLKLRVVVLPSTRAPLVVEPLVVLMSTAV